MIPTPEQAVYPIAAVLIFFAAVVVVVWGLMSLIDGWFRTHRLK